MKAVTLPINVIVVLMIVVLVAMSIIGFFLLAWGPGSSGIALEAKKQAGCFQWKCGISEIQPEGVTVDGMTLQEVCNRIGGGNEETYFDCKKICNCPGT